MKHDTTQIKRACEAAGSQANLARLVGVSQTIVYQWVNGDRPVPSSKCPAIEAAVNCAVTVEDLKPNEKWVRVKDKKWPHPAGRPTHDYAGQDVVA